ncbi:MAG: AAA family ATPase [Fervidicoccaceae archaeon]
MEKRGNRGAFGGDEKVTSRDLRERLKSVIEEIGKYIVGQEDLFRLLAVSLLSGGHLLLRGPPGTAKTLTSRLLAMSIGGTFKRIQMTSDMLPSDLIGSIFYDLGRWEWSFREGPLFANVVLIDELNRASPRTQAALLEAMQEGKVSVEGQTRELPKPLLVVATEIAYLEEPGTFPLTFTVTDRFAFSYMMRYPDISAEEMILERVDLIDNAIYGRGIEPVLSPEEVSILQGEVRKIFVSDKVRHYIASLLSYFRGSKDLLAPPSTRASIWMLKGSRALAYMEGMEFVLPDHVKAIAPYVLRHRIFLKPEVSLNGKKQEDVIEEALKKVEVPKV